MIWGSARQRPSVRCRFVVICALLPWCAGSLWMPAAGAIEPAREFLEALRQRGYFDQALAYLDFIATSPLAPVAFLETTDLEKGITMIEASRVQRDATQREKLLDDAQRLLQQFVGQRAGHPLVNTARGQLGSLVVERARLRTEQAKSKDRAQNLAEARKLYQEAFQVFTKQREDLKGQLERMPKYLDEKDDEQRRLAERRDQLRTDYLQTLLLAAAIREEMTETVAPGSSEATAFLTEAAGLYDAIYKDYRTRIAGLYARMYQARCMQKLKKLKDAVGYLDELLDQPDTPDAFRTLKTKAFRYAMECWLDPSERKYVEAIRRGTDWIALARPADDRDPEWLVLRLHLARAHLMQAQEARKAKPNDRTVEASLAEARKMATFVARHTSEYQQEAQALLAQLGGPERREERGAAKTFAEARDFGRETLEAMETDALLIRELPERIKSEKDARAKADLEKQLAESRQNHQKRQQQARDQFRLALRLADAETPLNDLNLVRYFLSYLYFAEENFYESAVMGEFVARRFPDHSAARQCAKIAMASFLRLYGDRKSEDRDFEAQHVVSVAEFIATHWPAEPEGEEALGTLIPFMINAGQLDRALAFLDKIPESSGKRGDAELKTGQAVWAAYLQGAREIATQGASLTAAERDSRQARLQQLKGHAARALAAGYGRVQQGGVPDRATVLALLSLAQVYVEDQQEAKAIEVLEQPKLGPLTLVQQRHPSATEPSIVEETYKTALRAYIGGLRGASDRAAMLAKAQDTMTKMKEAIASTAGGQSRMIAVFVSLARSLEHQLQVASPDARVALSQGFEAFLKQIRSETSDISILNWVAETFISLGAGFEEGASPSGESARFYQEAKTTFEKILSDTKPDPQMLTQVQIRQAAVARKQRDFKGAIDIYVHVLADNPMLINVQVEAARTYQEWGAVPTKEELYDRAIGGHHPGRDGKNVIWGWGRIAQVTAQRPAFRDTFHDANVNLAWCRLLRAERLPAAERQKLLTTALSGLTVIQRLYPDLGGESWAGRYDGLARRIQQAKGEPATGLKASPAPSAGATPAATPKTASTR